MADPIADTAPPTTVAPTATAVPALAPKTVPIAARVVAAILFYLLAVGGLGKLIPLPLV